MALAKPEMAIPTTQDSESQPSFPTPQNLQLELQQIPNHLAARHARRRPQRREIKRGGERVGVAKEQHGRDPAARVLEREAGRVHLVLLDLAAAQVVHAAGRVDLGRELAGHVGQLRAGQDVEVVVGRVAAGVAFGADGGAEDDEVFCDACSGESRLAGKALSSDFLGRLFYLLAWMMYMAPMAPPALLKIHSCSRFT